MALAGLVGLNTALATAAVPSAAEHSPELPDYMNTWLVLGTFDNQDGSGFDRPYVDPGITAVRAGARVGEQQWAAFDDRLYCRNYDDYNDLYCYFQHRVGQPAERTVAYAHVYVFSPSARKFQLRVGSNDGFKTWVNGTLVASVRYRRQALKDQDRIVVSLKNGWNRLLLKLANDHKIWGFYARFCTPDGRNVEGLQYAINDPAGSLAVTTSSLPAGYRQWPYVWLSVKPGPYPHAPSNTPAANYFTLMAEGGQPPYSWRTVSGRLPDGLRVDEVTGKFTGICQKIGEYHFTARVTDSAGATASRQLSIAVSQRPNYWYELARLGGLVHSRGQKPVEQAELMARQGYQFVLPITKHHEGSCSWASKARTSSGNVGSYTGDELGKFKEQVVKRGMRYGFYYSLSEQYTGEKASFNEDDYHHGFPYYVDYVATHLEELSRYEPCMFWFDGARAFTPHDQTADYWEYDALYSLIKTLNPECLVLNNPGADTTAMDYGLGDIDVLSSEGWGGSYQEDWYWCNWPQRGEPRNPKVMPIDSWRYPNDSRGDCADWRTWIKVIVSMAGEGHVCNLDHSLGYEKVHEQIAEWMQGRVGSIINTSPGPIEDGPWGYDVIKDNTVYLHCLSNARGKVGLLRARELTVGPVPRKVLKANTLPDGSAVPFKQTGHKVTLSVGEVKRDAVDTIIALEMTGQ